MLIGIVSLFVIEIRYFASSPGLTFVSREEMEIVKGSSEENAKFDKNGNPRITAKNMVRGTLRELSFNFLQTCLYTLNLPSSSCK